LLKIEEFQVNFRSIACVFDVFCTHCKPEDGLYMISRPGV
jgi:hypothetical protein